MDALEEKKIKEYFEEFKKNEPPEIIIQKAGLYGEDLVLKKTTVNGITFYKSAPIKYPF
jgi:hypothetical protein